MKGKIYAKRLSFDALTDFWRNITLHFYKRGKQSFPANSRQATLMSWSYETRNTALKCVPKLRPCKQEQESASELYTICTLQKELQQFESNFYRPKID